MTKPHWLAPAGKTTTPSIVISFDTETTRTVTAKGEEHQLKVWDAIVRYRPKTEGTRQAIVYVKGEDAASLAYCLESSSEMEKETWAFAHNAGFDLTVTQLPVVLIARGWHLDFFNLGEESCVFVFRRDGKRIVITDSWSWLRCSLEDAAKDVRMRKVPLPNNDDPIELWHKRCRHDVEILDKLLCQFMDWWENNDLGSFGTTGAACGWRSLRKHVPDKAILVGPDGDRTSFERQAIFGGRKEVYRVGHFGGHWIADNDLVAAYPTTASAHRLPIAPIDGPTGMWAVNVARAGKDHDVIMKVEVITDNPCVPCKINGEVWWPVGRFRTTLTGPELRLAMKNAIDVMPITAQWYRLGNPIADWATWCLNLQHDSSGSTPPVVKRVAKGWGRSVIGRFALHTSELLSTRPSTKLGWHVDSGHDLDTGQPIQIVDVGGTEYTYRQDTDGNDVFPAVLAFVEAHVRVAMAEIIAGIEPSKLLQVNTDGWWEQRVHPGKGAASMEGPWPYQIVRKALERELTVLGPNHVQTPTERRFAGIPRDAETNVAGKQQWLDWPGLKWQMENSEPGIYLRPDRQAKLEEHYCRRWVLTTGETIPVTTTVDADGKTTILPWSQTQGRCEGDELASHQIDALVPLVDDVPPILLSPAGSTARTVGRRGYIK